MTERDGGLPQVHPFSELRERTAKDEWTNDPVVRGVSGEKR
jgi:hypothetical protein